MKQRLQSRGPLAEESLGSDDIRDRALDFRGPWFDSRTACAYIPCRSLKAFYVWCHRHGIVRRANGSVAKADLDRALNPRQRRIRRMAPASLANLRKRRSG